jgi:hypothetical protein
MAATLRARTLVVAVGLLVAACGPRMVGEPPVPADAVTFRMSYHKTFDRVLRTLEDARYDVVIADRDRGYIETRPRAVAPPDGPGGPFEYQSYVVIRIGGGWRQSWAVVRLLVLPSYPKEREQLIDQLRGAGKRSEE